MKSTIRPFPELDRISRIRGSIPSFGSPFGSSKVAFSSPASGSTVKGEVEITGICDGSNVQLVEVKIDNGSYYTALNTGSTGDWDTWSYKWDSGNADDGDHTVTVRAKSGDQSPTANIVLETDNGNEPTNGGGGNGEDSPGFQLIGAVFAVLLVASLYFSKLQKLRRNGG